MPKKAKVIFFKCKQGSQVLGGNDEHMVSEVKFHLEVDGKEYKNLSVQVKQTVGEDYKAGKLEVSLPTGYKGPLNFMAFREGVEKYYRQCVGPQARGIRIEGPATYVTMMNNTFEFTMVYEFEIPEKGTGW